MEQMTCEHCECEHEYKRVVDFRIWKLRFIIEVHDDDESFEEAQVVSKTEDLR